MNGIGKAMCFRQEHVAFLIAIAANNEEPYGEPGEMCEDTEDDYGRLEPNGKIHPAEWGDHLDFGYSSAGVAFHNFVVKRLFL